MKRSARACKVTPSNSMSSVYSSGKKSIEIKPDNKKSESSSPQTTRQGKKRKSGHELKIELEPIVVKEPTINTEINGVVSISIEKVLNEEKTPWASFQPFSPRKSSWMLQEVYKEVKENRKIIEMLQTGNHNFGTTTRLNELLTGKWVKGCGEVEEKKETEEETNIDETEEEEKVEVDVDDEKIEDEEVDEVKSDKPNYPLETMEDLNKIEEKLRRDSSYSSHLMNNVLLILPGKDSSTFLNNILKCLFTNELATQFSYTGKAPLRSFKLLLLCDSIKRAVRKKYPDMASETFFTDRLSSWLSGCKRKVRQLKTDNK